MINALIVDDDMATVEVVRNAVHWKQLGVENVSKAYNIEQAKKILLNEPINLVISDVEMPMGSGLDLLCWFREQKWTVNSCFLPVMKISAMPLKRYITEQQNIS